MRFLFSFIFAGIAARLKPTVTALLQRPLQRFRAPTRAGDISQPENPPPSYTAVNPRRPRRFDRLSAAHARGADATRTPGREPRQPDKIRQPGDSPSLGPQ